MSDRANTSSRIAPPELGDMPPDEFRAAAHAVVDLMADYLEIGRGPGGLPGDRTGLAAAAVPGGAPEDPEPLEADPRRLPPAHRTQCHALAAPGLPGLFRDDRVGSGDPRRDADGHPRAEPDALADLADRHRTRGGRRRTGCARPSACRRRSTDS